MRILPQRRRDDAAAEPAPPTPETPPVIQVAEPEPPSIYQDVPIEELREHYATVTDLDYINAIELLKMKPQDEECIRLMFARYPENGLSSMEAMMLADDAYTRKWNKDARSIPPNFQFVNKLDENEVANLPEDYQAKIIEGAGSPEQLRLFTQGRWDVSPMCEATHLDTLVNGDNFFRRYPGDSWKQTELTQIAQTCSSPVTALTLWGAAVNADGSLASFRAGYEGRDVTSTIRENNPNNQLDLHWKERFGDKLAQYTMPHIPDPGYEPRTFDTRYGFKTSQFPDGISHVPTEAVPIVGMSHKSWSTLVDRNRYDGSLVPVREALRANKNVDEPRRLDRMLELGGPDLSNPEMAWFFDPPMKDEKHSARLDDTRYYPPGTEQLPRGPYKFRSDMFEYYDPDKMREYGLDEKDIQLAKAFIIPQGLGGGSLPYGTTINKVVGDMRDPNRMVTGYIHEHPTSVPNPVENWNGEETHVYKVSRAAGPSEYSGWQLAINYDWNTGHVYQATPEQLHQRMMGLIGEHPRNLGNGSQASIWHRDQITGIDHGVEIGYFPQSWAELPWPPRGYGDPGQPKPASTAPQSAAAPIRVVEPVEPVEAVVIGPPQIGDFLRQMKPEWKFLPDLASPGKPLDVFKDAERWPEVVLIVDDAFFDPTGSNSDMPLFISGLAADALVAVISYRPEWQQLIANQVAEQADINGYWSAPFYFIDPDHPQTTLEQAIIQFIKYWQAASKDQPPAEEQSEDDKWFMGRRGKQVRRLRASELTHGWGSATKNGKCSCGHIWTAHDLDKPHWCRQPGCECLAWERSTQDTTAPSKPQPAQAEPAQTPEPVEAVLVGPPQIGEFMRQMSPEWDFLPDYSSPTDLRNDFLNGSFGRPTDALFIVDDPFFDPTGDDDAMPFVIAAYAPITFVAVISWKPECQQQLIDQVAEQATINDFVRAPFYFIDPNNPQATLDQAISQFGDDQRRNPEGTTSALAKVG